MATTRSVTINITANAGAASKSIRTLGVELNALKATLQAVTGVSEKTAGAIRDVGNASAAAKNAAKSAASAQNETAMATERIGETAKRSSGMFGNFAKSIGRIAMYRAIRSALSAVTQAFKEGLENAYNYSKLFSDGPMSNLAKSMDSVKAASSQMKNQLGAALGGLVQAVAPAIEFLISCLTRLAQILTQVFSLFGGSGTYLKATSGLVDGIGDAAGRTGGKMKGLLASFDELNVIGKEASGGGASTDYSDMFENAEIESWIKEAFDTSGIGESIERLKKSWEGLVDAVKNGEFKEGLTMFVLDPLRTTIDLLDGIVMLLRGIMTGDLWLVGWSGLKIGFDLITNTVILPYTRTIDYIFGTHLSEKILAMKNVVDNGLADIANLPVWATLREKITEVFTTKDGIAEFFDLVVTGVFSAVWVVKTTISTVWNWIVTNVLNPAIDGINLLGRSAAAILGKTYEDIKHLDTVAIEPFEDMKLAANSASEAVKSAFAGMKSYLNNALSATPTITYSYNNAPAITSATSIGLKDKAMVSLYGDGGWPDAGELFMAREAGPELVGRIGNRTAVASNDQIVSGIVGGVEQANSEQNDLLREGITLLGAIARGVRNGIQLTPSVELGQVVQRSEALYARS